MRRVVMFLFSLVALTPLVFMPAPEAQGQAIGSGTVTLNWINPTQYTDGSPLVLNQIKVYREVNGAQIWNLIDSLPSGIQSYVDDSLFNGTYCYAVTATDFQNLESVRSNSACKTINAGGNFPLPKAPTGLTAQ